MKFCTLIRRNLRFHWRAHLGVVLGAAVGSAALIGALVVGDSVKESLRERALERLGRIHYSLNAQDKLFREVVANNLRERLANTTFSSFGDFVNVGELSSVLLLPASASRQDGKARANHLQVIGVDDQPLLFSDGVNLLADLPDGKVVVNESLATQLHIKKGDTFVLRVQKTSALSQEVAISSKAQDLVAFRLNVLAIAPRSTLADFSLVTGSARPMNAFVNLRALQQSLQIGNEANVLLLGDVHWAVPAQNASVGQLINKDGTAFLAMDAVNRVLREIWKLADYQLDTRSLPTQDCIELRTPRVFVDSQVTKHVLDATHRELSKSELFMVAGIEPLDYNRVLLQANELTNAQPLLTYLATLLQAGTNVTPYSTVTAAGPPWTPADLRDEEILVNQWLAEDLQVKPGDKIAMSYFLPESGAKLTEATNTFRVRDIVPMEMPWADRTLMPDFPGIEKAESTRDWDAGFPLTYKIRQKDEDYWKQHRGTPKAFITLTAGQKMWANRFGNLTAIRFPIPANSVRTRSTASRSSAKDGDAVERVPTVSAEDYRAALERKILATLKPEELGLRFEPVREQALQAAAQSQDFGGLFLGFSLFLIAAALLLMAMLFQLGLEQRAPEIGTFLALGFTPKQVRKLLLGEGVALSLLGGLLGALGGLAYAKVILHGLTTIWRDAVGATTLSFHVTGQTLVIGLFASVVVSVVTIWLTLRRFVRRAPRELLAGEHEEPESKAQSPRSTVLSVAALVMALALVVWTMIQGETANAGAFFGAGALVLVAGLVFAGAWLAKLGNFLPASCRQRVTLGSLSLRGCALRRKRSLATVAMLACGSFLIVSIGVFRLDANRDATKRTSGTGGFALLGETTMPVVQDLNSQSGRDFFALKEGDLAGVNFVPFRVREGDEASCLNLSRAQKPKLLGVKPEVLEGRFAFSKGAGWQSLKSENRNLESGIEIPAIGDANSIQWAMHKKVGDTIDYVDERGHPFKVRIVGAVANSILQGQLIIDEAEFLKRFPGESGYRMSLIDAPSNRVTEVSATLSRAMQDVGLELTPAAQRLAQFNAVQNTYLGTFQVLGGLGLLLGSVGLGIVVLRNVLERRGELAVLLAVGFRKPALQRLLVIENGALLGLGLAVGVIAAAVAVLPALLSPRTQLPWLSLGLTLAAVLVNGALWTWAATRFAVRGDLLQALRNE